MKHRGKTLTEVIKESWEGARRESDLLRNKSDDFFIGYVAAITIIDCIGLGYHNQIIAEEVRRMVKAGEI